MVNAPDCERPVPETWTTKRARVAGLVLRNAPPERIDEARADLAVTRLADHIQRVIAAAPPLTPGQAALLRSLLPAPDGGDGDAQAS